MMRLVTASKTAVELGLKRPGEAGAEARKFVLTITLEPAPPSRSVC